MDKTESTKRFIKGVVEEGKRQIDGRVANSLDGLVGRYRRRRSAKVLRYDPCNQEAMPGDLMVDLFTGKLYRLEQSSGWGKRMSGDLTPREIPPPTDGLIACIKDNEIWWMKPPNDSGQPERGTKR